MIDSQWPHQVAVDAATWTGRADDRLVAFCQPLSLAPRTHTFRENDRWMSVYCFADRAHAEKFAAEFGGRFVDPGDRPQWPGKRRGSSRRGAVSR